VWRISSNWKGGLYKLFGCVCFAIVNSLIRYVTGGANNAVNNLSFYQIVFLENLIGATILLPWMLRKGVKLWITKWPLFHLIRVLFSVLGMFFWYASLKFMPIAQALSLSFTGPILGLFGAKIFLKEDIERSRLWAILLSLVGAFLIIKPHAAFSEKIGSNLSFDVFVLLPILSGAAFAGTTLCDRALGKRGESPQLLTLYLLIFMAPLSFIPAFIDWHTPRIDIIIIISLMSVLSTLAYMSFAQAFKLASVSFLTPFGFSKFIFSAIVAYFAFKEFPTGWNFWFGTGLILLSIVFLSYHNSLKKIYIKFFH
jgi:S-adenosylmethionine uptake transporter